MIKSKKLLLIPMLLIAALLINCWFTLLTTDFFLLVCFCYLLKMAGRQQLLLVSIFYWLRLMPLQ